MKEQMTPHLFQCLVQIVLMEDLALVIWEMLLQRWLACALSPGASQACTSVGIFNQISGTLGKEMVNFHDIDALTDYEYEQRSVVVSLCKNLHPTEHC